MCKEFGNIKEINEESVRISLKLSRTSQMAKDVDGKPVMLRYRKAGGNY